MHRSSAIKVERVPNVTFVCLVPSEEEMFGILGLVRGTLSTLLFLDIDHVILKVLSEFTIVNHRYGKWNLLYQTLIYFLLLHYLLSI